MRELKAEIRKTVRKALRVRVKLSKGPKIEKKKNDFWCCFGGSASVMHARSAELNSYTSSLSTNYQHLSNFLGLPCPLSRVTYTHHFDSYQGNHEHDSVVASIVCINRCERRERVECVLDRLIG